MTNFFQMNVGRKLVLAVMLGVTAAISGNEPIWSAFNSSFPGGNDRLSEPIVIPNLTAHSQPPFTSASRTTQTQQIKNNAKTRGYFLGKIFYPDESLSQESKIDVKFAGESNSDDNSLKFSSRYSSTPETSKETTESSEESEGDRTAYGGEKNERNITSTDDVSIFEQDKILSSETIPGEENYKSLSDFSENPYPTYFGEDEKADIHRYSGANEPRETEELEVSPATNEPYPELQRPTSFQNSPYPDEESGNYETSSEISRESDSSTEEEEKRLEDRYRESGPKDYGSIQTPLKEIKFRGPHSVKDDFESERSIARLSPIRRHPISHNWPYSKAQLKEGAEKLNEISNETEESEEGTKPNSKLLGLERAAANDEAEGRQTKNKKPNHIRDRNRSKDSGLSGVEAKDQNGLLYEGIKAYRTEARKKPLKVQPTLNYAPRPRPNIKVNKDLWSAASPTKTTVYEELFSRQAASKKIKPTKFNTTKELDSNFPSSQFVGPVMFKQNIDKTKTKPSEKPRAKNSQKETSRDSKELEKKETIDLQNLKEQKIQKTILAGADAEIPSQIFDHQEESDEMYNQILANIQSVFGLRTQPLKAQSLEQPELNVEENRALTWALPLRKREKAKPEIPKKSSLGGSDNTVKSGRD